MKRKGKAESISLDESILSSMSKMGENCFSKEILVPLFESMGFERVEFYGGILERGKDIVASRSVPPLRGDYVLFVQVKRVLGMKATSDAARLSQLLHQLRQCCNGSVLDPSGKALFPNSVFLACPELMPQRLLDEIATQLHGMSPAIEIYDGPRILSDIRIHKPDLLQKLSSVRDRLIAVDAADLANSELLRALSSQSRAATPSFYTDLSFFVGSIDSNLLMHLSVEMERDAIKIDPERWATVAKQLTDFQETFKLRLIAEDFEAIERRFAVATKRYNSRKNQAKLFELDDLSKRLSELSATIHGELKRLELSARAQRGNKSSAQSVQLEEGIASVREAIRLKKEISALPAKGGVRDFKSLRDVAELYAQAQSLQSRMTCLESEMSPQPTYDLTLDSAACLEAIQESRARYAAALNDTQSRKSKGQLRTFLMDTQRTLALIGALHNESFELRECFRFRSIRSGEDRISISPHDVFDSRLNVALYGGAGVGKTTTLKAYARECQMSGRADVVYVPLNRALDRVEHWTRCNDDRTDRRNSLLARLMLASRGLADHRDAVSEAQRLLASGITLILDGLDEAFDRLPELVPAINAFHSNNPKSQLIVSSRDCASYLKDIDFLGITLLPFTPSQLNAFVTSWVVDKKRARELIHAIEKQGLYEHIKTPLLATIACVLINKGVKVISNEREVYAERLRLLSGEYDLAKGIVRQTQSPDLLRRVAIDVGYAMHCAGVRSLPWDQLLKEARSACMSRISPELVETCLRELHDPCNILVHEPEVGQFSFGHFRFQEHLAAEELKSNRDADIAARVTSDWWRGALCLYAQQADVSIVLQEVYEAYGNVRVAQKTLDAMVANSPEHMREGLRAVLKQQLRQDDYELFMLAGDGEFAWR